MNCKPGDVAIIVKFSSTFDSRMAPRDHENVGRIVKVFRTMQPLIDEPCWHVTAVGMPLISYTWGTPPYLTKDLGIQDSWLRPISGTIAENELIADLEVSA